MASVGTVFSSTGTFPMSPRQWDDHSTVTVADRPGTFEFTTDGEAGPKNAMRGLYRHRYEIAADGDGSRVTYTVAQEAVSNPMLRETLPGIRQLVWRVAMPRLSGGGLRNLLTFVEERVASQTGPTSATVHPMPMKEG
jgi:hypothetical protein